MKELALIINQNGEYMSFGTWKPNNLRKKENSDDWHDECFREKVYPTEWFQNLGIPYNEDLSFYNQLPMFAKCGIVVVINDTNEVDKGSFIIVAPNTITNEQIQILFDKKEDFINFENNNSLIDILDVDQDYDVLQSFYHINDYYDYLENILTERKGPKK